LRRIGRRRASDNARLRDELLDGEIFYSLAEARILIESWRRHYNTERPHGSLGYKPPAPDVFIPPSPRGRLCNIHQRRRPR
jgi:transposase InsO family protein